MAVRAVRGRSVALDARWYAVLRTAPSSFYLLRTASFRVLCAQPLCPGLWRALEASLSSPQSHARPHREENVVFRLSFGRSRKGCGPVPVRACADRVVCGHRWRHLHVDLIGAAVLSYVDASARVEVAPVPKQRASVRVAVGVPTCHSDWSRPVFASRVGLPTRAHRGAGRSTRFVPTAPPGARSVCGAATCCSPSDGVVPVHRSDEGPCYVATSSVELTQNHATHGSGGVFALPAHDGGRFAGLLDRPGAWWPTCCPVVRRRQPGG